MSVARARGLHEPQSGAYHLIDDIGAGLSADRLKQFRHDTKQSIATILCLVEVALGDADKSDVVVERLGQVAEQVRSTAALLDDLVVPDDVTTLDASAECAEVVRAVTSGFTGTVRMMTETNAEVSMSRVALRRVLTNLLQNAVRAAGRRGVVEASIRRSGHCVVLEVEDDGPGFGAIPTQHGVGLHSVRTLVERAHGYLDTGNGRLGGARLRVTLPSAALTRGLAHENPAV
jgi:signal transduction histidine kinase